MNNLLRSRLNALRSMVLAIHEGGAGLPSDVIGTEREAFIKGLLAEVYPATYRFVGGTIIDSMSKDPSGQIDIAVLLPSAPSFPMISAGDQRLLLAENVAVAIEVKSNLSTQWSQVKSTMKKIKVLKKFLRDVEPGVAAVTGIPTMAVGYEGWKDIQALREKWTETSEAERPDAVYTIKQNTFVSSYLQAEGDAALFAFIAFFPNVSKIKHRYKPICFGMQGLWHSFQFNRKKCHSEL